MIDFIQVMDNRFSNAKEDYNFSPRWIDVFIQTLGDFLCRKIIVDKETGSHIVYEVVQRRYLPDRPKSALITGAYTPKSHRGKKIISKMLDSIPLKSIITADKGVNNEEIARLYRRISSV